MNIRVLAKIFGFFFLAVPCSGEGIVTLTFDGPPTQPQGSRWGSNNYSERGTRFLGDCARAFPPMSTLWPDNGTPYIVPAQGMSCSRIDDLSFSLVSVDLAGYSSVVPDYTASFEARRADGTVVSTNFPVSGLGFQTYYFPSEFANLTNVSVRAGALDNLKLQLPAVQPVLHMGSYHYRSDSWLTLEAQGTAGLRYRMEYTDFFSTTNWITLTNFESSFFQVEYVSTNLPPQRFFRAVELP
jgi:hypothetical protein